MNLKLIEQFYDNFSELYKNRIDQVVNTIVKAKQEQKKITIVTGSGPNIHEGITTLIAELIHKGMVDGVLTSSAVVSHEMAGALDKVKRVNIKSEKLGNKQLWLPKGDIFELSELSPEQWKEIEKEMQLDKDLIDKLNKMEGTTIIKAAGNMAYPMGLRTERLAEELLKMACEKLNRKYPLEFLAGLGADRLTMIGAGAEKGIPIMVSVPQMIGGGAVGLCIGDSISIHDRCQKNAKMLSDSSVIIESGLALAQEIHDGPFETYTGHGIWSQWDNGTVYSLKGKSLIRFDLDPNLETVWQQQRSSGLVQQAIAEGKPKTKLSGVPFRMEMSGFARLETSIPVIGDLGEIWPVVAYHASKDLGIKLDFMSYKQETDEGKKMREWIVNNVHYIKRDKLNKGLKQFEL